MLRVGIRGGIVVAAVTAGLCVAPAFASAKSVSSTFDNDLQGWTVTGDPAAGSPMWVSSGGNPGGYLSSVDGGQGVDQVAIAPSTYLGNKSAYYGGSLRFDRRIENTSGGSYFIPPFDVQLTGDKNHDTVDFSLATPPGATWTTQQVTLLPKDTSNGVSKATLEKVLKDLTSVGIEIEFIGGGETDDLDNVALATPSAPKITAAAQETFTTGTQGSYTITTTGSPYPSLSESGTLPAGVTFTDNGNGTATISGTPASNTAGSYPVVVKATNYKMTVTKKVTVVVH